VRGIRAAANDWRAVMRDGRLTLVDPQNRPPRNTRTFAGPVRASHWTDLTDFLQRAVQFNDMSSRQRQGNAGPAQRGVRRQRSPSPPGAAPAAARNVRPVGHCLTGLFLDTYLPAALGPLSLVRGFDGWRVDEFIGTGMRRPAIFDRAQRR
jgi:hypothetical protein